MQIDWWTLALQTINVLILVWILTRFFYRPVAAIIEERQSKATKLLADASAASSIVDSEKASVDAARAGLASERDKLLADARKQAEIQRDAVLKAAAQDAGRLRADNDAALARDRAAMEKAMIARAGSLAVDIARKLVQRLPPGPVVLDFLNALSERFGTLPEQTRELLLSAAETNGLVVTTAARLDEAQQLECRKAIEAMLKRQAKLTFGTDPGLIAGVEIRAEGIVLNNNWRDDLAHILQQLQSDDGQHEIP